ncbi:MAG: alpha-E domain-containing protein, partial [Acidobacteriaceae bacterium]|nr:alpha-E domain-containing protein [Acidobacteriaceae bacterium]
MQKGGHSKDAWILWDRPVDAFTLRRPRTEPVELRRGSSDLPSRVADNLFWLGRYAERSENIARLLRAMFSRVRRADDAELACLVRLHSCLDSGHSKLPKKRAPTALEFEQELISLLSDSKRPDSLLSTLHDVHTVGGRVRERLSSDMTRLVGELAASVQVDEYVLFVEYSAVLNGCLELLSAFSGMERENITRGAGWLFMSLGRRLERAIYSARQLREITTPLSQSDWPLLEFLLEVADSSMTYRSRYYTTLQPVAVMDVLMMDATNPRSLDFQLSHLLDLYQKLPRHAEDDARAMRDALGLLRRFDLKSLNYPLPGSTREASGYDDLPRLERFLSELVQLLFSWSNNLSNTYFSHARTLPIIIGE